MFLQNGGFMKIRNFLWGALILVLSLSPLFAQNQAPNPPRQLIGTSSPNPDGTYNVKLSWFIDKANYSNYVFPDGFNIYQTILQGGVVKNTLVGSINSNPNQFSYEYIITNLAQGTYQFYVTSFKGNVQSQPSNKITLQLYNENKYYIKIISQPPLYAYVGKKYVYQIKVTTNLDCPIDVFEFEGDVPEGMTISPTGLIEWTPQQTGIYKIEVKAGTSCKVNVEAARQTFKIQVLDSVPPNEKPYVRIISQPQNFATIGIPWVYKVITETNVYCVVRYKILETDIQDLEINEETGLISWTPQKPGVYNFTVMAYLLCDDNVYDKQKVTINVEENNANNNCVHLVGYASFEDGTLVPNGVAIAWKLDSDNNQTNSNFKTTIQQGFFQFFLPPGVYVFEFNGELFDHQFYDKATRLLDATKISLDCEKTPEFTLKVVLTKKNPPELYKVSGYVLDANDNSPVPAMVEFIPVEMLFKPGKLNNYGVVPRFVTKTDNEGKYEIELPNNFAYIAHAIPLDKTAYADQYYQLSSSPYNADIIVLVEDLEGIDFLLKPQEKFNNGFAGIVIDKDRNPIESRVIAILVKPNEPANYAPNSTIRVVETDQQGHFLFQNLPPGEYVLLSIPKDPKYVPGYYKMNDFATLKWREATRVAVDKVMIQIIYEIKHKELSSLKGLVTFCGYVGEASGIMKSFDKPQSYPPIGESLVLALDIQGNVINYTLADKDGYFILEELPAGMLKLLVSKVGYKDLETTVDANFENNSYLYFEFNLEKEVSSVEIDNNLNLIVSQTEDFLLLETTSETEIQAVKLFDLYGKLVVSNENIQATSTRIPINSISSGIYFISVATNKGLYSGKVSIVR